MQQILDEYLWLFTILIKCEHFTELRSLASHSKSYHYFFYYQLPLVFQDTHHVELPIRVSNVLTILSQQEVRCNQFTVVEASNSVVRVVEISIYL